MTSPLLIKAEAAARCSPVNPHARQRQMLQICPNSGCTETNGRPACCWSCLTRRLSIVSWLFNASLNRNTRLETQRSCAPPPNPPFPKQVASSIADRFAAHSPASGLFRRSLYTLQLYLSKVSTAHVRLAGVKGQRFFERGTARPFIRLQCLKNRPIFMSSKPHLASARAPLNTNTSCVIIYYLIIYLFLRSCFINLTGCGRVATLQMSVSVVHWFCLPFSPDRPPLIWILIRILLQNCSNSSTNGSEKAGL